jgi:soluble lytic murein transglycosylase-like protein
MIGSLISRMADAEKLSVAQLQKAVQAGTLPAYVGIPLIQDKMNQQKEAQAMMQGGQQKQPPIADQVMAEAAQHGIDEAQSNLYPQETGMPAPMPRGIDEAQSNLPTQEMAGGGIVAFAEGDLVEDDEEDDSIEERRQVAKRRALTADAAARMQEGTEAGLGIGSISPEKAKAVAYSINPESKGGFGFKDKIEHLESRGRDYDEKGNILTSSKGAMGRMQTMPNTLRDPGFGVKPARNNSPEEMARVGRDYADALKDYYKGNEKIAAIAYNMGPGATDKWLASGADINKLPGETRKYQAHFAEGGIAGIKRYANTGLVEDDSGGYSELGIPMITSPNMGNLAAATPGSREFLGLPPIKEKPKKETKATKHEDMVKDLPPAGPLTQGAPPSGPGIDSVVTPKEPSLQQQYIDLLKGREASSAKQRSVDKYMSLLQAGLGMLGGTSPHAAVNIGQGASTGIAAKMAADRNRIAEENATMKGYGNLYDIEQTAEYRKTLAGQGQEASQRKAAGQQLLSLEQKTKQNYMNQFTRSMIGASPEDIAAAADKATMADLAKNDTYRNMFKLYNGYDYAAPAMAPTVVDYSKTYGLTPKSK